MERSYKVFYLTEMKQRKIFFFCQQVGSGPGGAVVANRLSEVPNWKVLLLEAGKEETILLDIPIFVSYTQFTDYNWGFKAEPQEGACLGIEENRCRWPRGKSLGGKLNCIKLIKACKF